MIVIAVVTTIQAITDLPRPLQFYFRVEVPILRTLATLACAFASPPNELPTSF